MANLAIKPWVRRSRPPGSGEGRPGPVTSSFPSGHTATDLAFSLAVSQEIPALFIPLTVATTAAHWSMVRSRGHYPSDVLVGGVLGIAVAVTAWRLWPPGEHNKQEPPPESGPGSADEEQGGTDGPGEPTGLERAKSVAVQEKEAYEAGSDRPVGSFLAIMGVYVAGVGGIAVPQRLGHGLAHGGSLRSHDGQLPQRLHVRRLPVLRRVIG